MNPKVDAFLREAETWRAETAKLRAIALRCGLTEELKWGKPCYTFQESNVVIIQGFKEYCALLFCKGSLLKDKRGILVKPGEHSQAMRQARFTSLKEIVKAGHLLRAYIHEAIKAERVGLKVEFKKNPEPIPQELQNRLVWNSALRTAFFALTPGRQRFYIIYFSAPKQSKTRDSRIDKYMGKILSGKGFHD